MRIRDRLYNNRYSLITCLLLVVIYLTFKLQFETNDDAQIMNYISGLYSGEPGVMDFYMGAAYSWVLVVLYRITMQVSWYSVLFLVINGAAVVVIGRTMVREGDPWPKYLAFLAVVGSLYLYCLVQVQYTTVGGFAAAAALVLLAYLGRNENHGSARWQIAGVAVFLFLCYNVRSQDLPVAIVVALYIVLSNKVILRHSIRNQVLALAACLIVLAGSFAVNELYAVNTGWKAYGELQTARGRYMDYNRLAYDEAEEVYDEIGWDAGVTEVIRNWCFRVEESTTENYTVLNEHISSMAAVDRFAALGSNVRGFLEDQRRETVFMALEALWILFLWIGAIRRHDQQRIRTCLYITGLFLLQSAFIGYLILDGRYKERVMYMVFYMCSTPMMLELLDVMFEQRQEQEKNEKGRGQGSPWLRYLPILFLAFMVYLGYTRVSWRNMRSYDSVDAAEAYALANRENLYMADFSFVNDQRMFRSFDKNTLLTNLVWWGGWLQGSDLDQAQLRANGLETLYLSDMLQDGRYFVGSNTDAMSVLDEYYHARYENVVSEIVYQSEDIVVYQYSIAE